MFDIVDAEKMAHYAEDEKHIREENLRLQRKLQMEIERREALCRHLSESESSLEMDDERWVLIGVYTDCSFSVHQDHFQFNFTFPCKSKKIAIDYPRGKFPWY